MAKWRAEDPFGMVVEIDDNISAFLRINGAVWCEHVIDPKRHHSYSDSSGVYRTCWRKFDGRVAADADPTLVIETIVHYDDRGFLKKAFLGEWLKRCGYDPDHAYSEEGKTMTDFLCDWIRETERRLRELERSI